MTEFDVAHYRSLVQKEIEEADTFEKLDKEEKDLMAKVADIQERKARVVGGRNGQHSWSLCYRPSEIYLNKFAADTYLELNPKILET
jgi:hypothetical protein